MNNLKPNSVFLDNVTGDYYSFDKYLCQWKPKGNVGLHNFKAIEVSAATKARDMVTKTQIYRAQATPTNTNLYFQKGSDVKCYVDKHHQSHWLFN